MYITLLSAILTFYHPHFLSPLAPYVPIATKVVRTFGRILFFVSCASRLTNLRIRSYRTLQTLYWPALSSLTIKWGVEAIFCYAFPCTRVHVYVLCVLILTGQSLLQLSLVLCQRLWLFYFLLDATVMNAYTLYKESVQKRMLIVKEFVLRVYEHLLSSTNCRKRSSIEDPPQQLDCVSATSRIVWTGLKSARLARREAEQELAVRLAVLSDLLFFPRFIALAYTTRNSTRVSTVLCDYFTDSHFISVYLCKLVWIIAWHHGHSR